MKHSFYFLNLFLIAFISCKSTKQNNEIALSTNVEHNLSMYPESLENTNRHIISLPVQEDESLYNLEIWSGKTEMVDCNKHLISGSFKKHLVKGWGYFYYEFIPNDHQLSTRMACPDTTLTEKFIRSNTEHIRYNSKLPIVVYCPKGYSIQYSIWSKDKTPLEAAIK